MSENRQVEVVREVIDAFAGKIVDEEPTPANRTFTTAELVRGDLLAVDSQFGFPAAAWVAEDRIVPLDRPVGLRT